MACSADCGSRTSRPSWRRRCHQGRAAGRRGDARGRVRGGRVPAGQAQPGTRHQRCAGPAGRRAAAGVGRRGAAQLQGRGGRTARHRRRHGRPAEPGGRLLPCQRVRRYRPARDVPRQRRADAGGDRVRAGHRRGGQRPDRGDVDSDRHDGRLGRRGGRAGRPVRAGDRRRRTAGRDQPARRRDPAAQRGVLARRRARPRPVA